MFKSRNYSSEETYDIGKFIPFEGDTYDVLNSPLLEELKKLPVDKYYNVNDVGYKDIDLIATYAYGNSFLAFYIQYYNNNFLEVYPEGTVLKLFSLDDFTNLCGNLLINNGEYL